MLSTGTKPTLRQMFGREVAKERVEELLQNADFKARQSLIKLGTELYQRKGTDEVFSNLYDLYDAGRQLALEALSKKIHAAGWNGAEFSAAAMFDDGMIVLE